MSRIPVYVLGSYHPDAIAHLQSAPNISPVLPTDPANSSWPSDAVGLLVRWNTRLGETEFANASRLKVVVKQGVGVDNIDLDAARRHGVKVYNTPAVNSEAVAELTLTLALCLARRVCEMDRRLHAGERLVRGEALFAKSLWQSTVGVIGMGNIGREVARKWRGAMDARVVTFDPYFPADGWADLPHTRVEMLGELLEVADVVTVHVPLTPETRGLIGEKQLALMKRGSILLNTARGGIVDEDALLEALRAEKFWGVGLDATNVEPPTLEVYREFLQHQNMVMMPHVGGDTIETQIRSGIVAVDTLLTALGKEEPKGRQA